MSKSGSKDTWETPDELFADYHQRFHFILDAAANETNHKLPRWFGPGGEQEDALKVQWPLHEGNIWLNPPYSRGLQRAFIEKVIDEVDEHKRFVSCPEGELRAGQTLNHVVALLPADTSTALFHDLIWPNRTSVDLIRGRVQFKGAPGKPRFASMVVIF